MTSFSIDLPNVEIIDGTFKGSKYLVIAKAQGLKLAVKMETIPYPRDEDELPANLYIHLGARFRVELDDDSGDLEKASEVFGVPHLRVRDGKPHASVLGGIPVCTLDTHPQAFRQAVIENALLTELATNITAVLEAAGVSPIVSPYILAEYLAHQLDEEIPEMGKVGQLPRKLFFVDENNPPKKKQKAA